MCHDLLLEKYFDLRTAEPSVVLTEYVLAEHLFERPPCASRISALQKTLRCYAEKKRETVVIPVVGDRFDSLGEAYDYYNLYFWEIGFGVGYGKSRLNVERTKCMQEIVCGCSVSDSSQFQPEHTL